MYIIVYPMKVKYFSYRYAQQVLSHPSFKVASKEIKTLIKKLEVALRDPSIKPKSKPGAVKKRDRDGAPCFFLPVDQITLNEKISDEIVNINEQTTSEKEEDRWSLEPLVVEKNIEGLAKTGLKADFKKGKLIVEVQFGNMSRWYSDLFKFQLSYALEKVDVAILVVPTKRFANFIDENVAHFERVTNELSLAKTLLNLPVLVIGIEPDEDGYNEIKECYEAAASKWVEPGQEFVPFTKRYRVKK